MEVPGKREGFWLIVTGTGRCGTGYMAQVLNSVGISCGHERTFKHYHPRRIRHVIRKQLACPDAQYQASSSWMAAPYLGMPELEGVTVVHLVRHPKKTIDSMMRLGTYLKLRNYYGWQAQWLPEIAIMQPLEACVTFILRWSKMIRPHADMTWRVEDDVHGLLDRLEIDYTGKEIFSDTSFNTRKTKRKSDVTLKQIGTPLSTELLQWCDEYGYTWPVDK